MDYTKTIFGLKDYEYDYIILYILDSYSYIYC